MSKPPLNGNRIFVCCEEPYFLFCADSPSLHLECNKIHAVKIAIMVPIHITEKKSEDVYIFLQIFINMYEILDTVTMKSELCFVHAKKRVPGSGNAPCFTFTSIFLLPILSSILLALLLGSNNRALFLAELCLE